MQYKLYNDFYIFSKSKEMRYYGLTAQPYESPNLAVS